MGIVLIIALSCILVGQILLAIAAYQMHKFAKQYMYEVERASERLRDLVHEMAYIIDR